MALLVLAAAAYAASVTCDGGRCEGTEESDEIEGSVQVDAIYALGGDDVVSARTGHDYVRAGGGQDVTFGRPGADTIRGGPRADQIYGGQGDDNMFGQDGGTLRPLPGGGSALDEGLVDDDPNDADSVYGGPGYEFVFVGDGDGDDYVDCGPGRGIIFSADPGDVVENCDTELPGNAHVRLSSGDVAAPHER